jgi:hypothetical protein
VTASQLKRFHEGEAGADIHFANFRELDNSSNSTSGLLMLDSEVDIVP